MQSDSDSYFRVYRGVKLHFIMEPYQICSNEINCSESEKKEIGKEVFDFEC